MHSQLKKLKSYAALLHRSARYAVTVEYLEQA